MKSVLVTGGAGGIGEAICLKFAEKGYFVGVGYNNSEAEAKKIAEKIGGAAIKIDVTDAESVNSAVESFAKQSGANGAINILVNCAGIALPIKTLLDVTEAEYDKIFAVNMKGVFLSVKAVLPHMLEKGGAIINVSSMWGLAGGSCEAVYSASKSAVIGFTKALAKEFAGANIRVNAVAPGFIDTKMNNAFSEEDRELIGEDIPLGRFGLPEDVAKAVLYLADDADFVTGITLNVSGGEVV